MNLSILIVNWNSADYVRRCLHSLRSVCEQSSVQVVVVDGGSYDGCAEMIAAEFPGVEFVQATENAGFGAANNLGFKRVRGESVLLLNPDTEVLSGAVERLVEELETLPGAALVGPRLLNSDGSLQASCVQSLPTPWNQFVDAAFLHRSFPQASAWGYREAFASLDPVLVEAVSGACMLLRSSTFRDLGGFDRRFFMYGEDMDLCRRVQDAGGRVYHVPASRVIHHGGGSSSNQASKFTTVHFHRSVHLFIEEHQGGFAALVYRTLIFWSSLFRLGVLALVLAVKRNGPTELASLRRWRIALRWSLGRENSIECHVPAPIPAEAPLQVR